MRVEPLTIGAGNAVAMTGMSWTWCVRFAAQHGVPIYRVGTRKQLIDARALLAAIAHAAERAAPAELTDAQIEARFLAELGLEEVPGSAAATREAAE